ncbi:MAG: M48 family metalloprotease [Bdellovibrionales bacterium]|nr:M48 family metalloprotease [Bdellovibrionales bacterium]
MKGSTKTWTLLAALSLTIILISHGWGGRQGLLWGVIIALSINCLIYFYNDLRLDSLFPGQLVEGQNPWGLLQTAKTFASKARIPVPRVVILNSPAPQALVMGRNWKSATIVLTEGLLRSLTREEREAVIAYQISCIKKLDTLAFSVASAFTDFLFAISLSVDLVIRGILGPKKDPHSRQNHLFSLLIAPFASLLVRLAVGTGRYLANDSLAASWVENPKALAQALWKLESYAATRPMEIPAATAPLFIVNPLTGHGWTRYFHVHPSVEKRIRNLIGYYPI